MFCLEDIHIHATRAPRTGRATEEPRGFPPAGSHRDGKSSVSSRRRVSVGQLRILCALSASAPSAFLKDAEKDEQGGRSPCYCGLQGVALSLQVPWTWARLVLGTVHYAMTLSWASASPNRLLLGSDVTYLVHRNIWVLLSQAMKRVGTGRILGLIGSHAAQESCFQGSMADSAPGSVALGKSNDPVRLMQSPFRKLWAGFSCLTWSLDVHICFL